MLSSYRFQRLHTWDQSVFVRQLVIEIQTRLHVNVHVKANVLVEISLQLSARQTKQRLIKVDDLFGSHQAFVAGGPEIDLAISGRSIVANHPQRKDKAESRVLSPEGGHIEDAQVTLTGESHRWITDYQCGVILAQHLFEVGCIAPPLRFKTEKLPKDDSDQSGRGARRLIESNCTDAS